MSLRTAALLACLAVPAAAFEIPLTRGQRAQKLVEEGQYQILRGEYQRAIDSCTRALGIIEDWAPAFLCRGEARLMTKDPGAQNDALAALRLDPKSGDPYRLLGVLSFKDGNYAEAVGHFDQALAHTKIRPDSISDIFYYRGRCRLHLGQTDEALKDVDRGIGVLRGVSGDYGDWGFYSLRAEIRRRRGEPNAADEDERRVVDLITQRMSRRPQELTELLKLRAQSHALLRDYAKAAEDYDRVLERAGPKAELLYERAALRSRAGGRDAALRDLDSALKLDPKHTSALGLRALERMAAGRHAEAAADLETHYELFRHRSSGNPRYHPAAARGTLAAYRAFLASSPGTMTPGGHRAFALAMLSELAPAWETAVEALRASPNDPAALLAYARAAMLSKRCAEAAPNMDNLLAQEASGPAGRWMRGECRFILGSYKAAFEDLERAADLEPGGAFWASRLASLYREWLDSRGAPATPEELALALRHYDAARTGSPLSIADSLDWARTLADLVERLAAGGRNRSVRARLVQQADAVLEAILATTPGHQGALDLRRRVNSLRPPPQEEKPSRSPKGAPRRRAPVRKT